MTRSHSLKMLENSEVPRKPQVDWITAFGAFRILILERFIGRSLYFKDLLKIADYHLINLRKP